MLDRRLRVLLNIVYYHVLIYGLMPTTLRIDNCRLRVAKVSPGYLVYSAAVTLVLLIQVPCMMPTGYMRNHIVLQWGLTVTLVFRFVSVLSCYGLVWLQRRRLIRLYTECLAHWLAHWRALRRLAGEEALQRMQQDLAGQLCRKLCTNYAMLCCAALMQYRLLTRAHLLQLLMRVLAMLMLSVEQAGLFALLLLLTHQFRAVQLALQAQRRRAHPEQLNRIAAIHLDWLLLARRVFSVYDVANASIFAKMFAVHVNIFYHAVQFGNKAIQSDFWGIINGDGLIAFSIWDSLLLMNMLDDLPRISAQAELELELFAARLRGNRLVYRICGCVELDKPACLCYMASVLTNVIILMQFDLGRKKGT